MAKLNKSYFWSKSKYFNNPAKETNKKPQNESHQIHVIIKHTPRADKNTFTSVTALKKTNEQIYTVIFYSQQEL